MTENEKTTALIPSVGADGGQPPHNSTNQSIPHETCESNPLEENIEEMREKIRRMNDPHYLHTVSMTELYQTAYKSRPPVIDGLLYSGAYILAGAPKIGKSFLVAQLAYHVSTGQRLWGYEVHQGKFDVILMNPPYGGHEDKSIQGFFPDDLASSETADLFMSVILYRLKKNGRAAVVVPDGFLFGLDNAKVNIKKKLIGEFNLHTVVRLPGSVFSPYTSITTNLLFFDNTKPTTETWFYRVDIPSDRKHFSKTKPMELKHFDDCIAWWNNREVIPDGEYFKSQKFTADYLLNEQGCNIDLCGYPHEEEEVLDPLDTIREYQERRTSLNAEIDKVLAELEALLPGGVIK